MPQERNLIIREMTQKDVPEVHRLEEICFSLPWSEESIRDSLCMPSAIFLAAEDEGHVVGYVGMYQSFEEAGILNVAVDPSYRRRHIAESLLLELHARARREEVSRIFLEVRISNAPAIALYEKLGYTCIGTRKRFYTHPVEDAFTMEMNLC